MNDDDDLTRLRAKSAGGSRDATDQLVELAGERGDLDELRRLAESGSRDALDQLVDSQASAGTSRAATAGREW